MKTTFWQEIIDFKQNEKIGNIFDVSLKNRAELSQYDSIEMYFMIYPYAQNISSDNLKILPFEEYVEDIISEKSSVYTKTMNSSKNFFGLFLGLIIFIIFLFINPDLLYSVEAIASIFWFYIVGKELWDDINRVLIRFTRKRKIVYKDAEYSYELKSRNALTNYTFFAKKQRYWLSVVLPKRLSYIKQSNSLTIRMQFDTQDFVSNKDEFVHILSIKVDDFLIDDFKRNWYMLGCKVSFNKKLRAFIKKYDISQSINLNEIWCLDIRWKWHDQSVFVRNNICFLNLKYYKNYKLLDSKILFDKIQNIQK